MITDADVDLVAGRLNAWSIALGGLSDPDACRQFLTVLDEADGKALHKLIDRWNLPGEVSCIEIVDTITRFVHTGDFKAVETCSFVNKLRPPNPSTTSGMGYQLPDGTVLWLTESEWWQMMDHAVNDEVWRDRTTRCSSQSGSSSAGSRWSPRSSVSTSTSATRSAPPRGIRASDADYSIGRRPMAAGSRPPRSHPAAVAASGVPMQMMARSASGTGVRLLSTT